MVWTRQGSTGSLIQWRDSTNGNEILLPLGEDPNQPETVVSPAIPRQFSDGTISSTGDQFDSVDSDSTLFQAVVAEQQRQENEPYNEEERFRQDIQESLNQRIEAFEEEQPIVEGTLTTDGLPLDLIGNINVSNNTIDDMRARELEIQDAEELKKIIREEAIIQDRFFDGQEGENNIITGEPPKRRFFDGLFDFGSGSNSFIEGTKAVGQTALIVGGVIVAIMLFKK